MTVFARKTQFPIRFQGKSILATISRDRKTVEFIARMSLVNPQNLVTYRLRLRMHENFARPFPNLLSRPSLCSVVRRLDVADDFISRSSLVSSADRKHASRPLSRGRDNANLGSLSLVRQLVPAARRGTKSSRRALCTTKKRVRSFPRAAVALDVI